jgi:hypothetical protein
VAELGINCRGAGRGCQDGELEAGRRRAADGERWRQAGSKQWDTDVLLLLFIASRPKKAHT